MATTNWNGALSQEAMLAAENVIVVDENDKGISFASKRDSHLLPNIRAGMLHRAFSVLLFTPDFSKMLLHYRSYEKITFPGVLTNACCSHPLYDLPEERDEVNHSGVIRAAIRKLDHELGIPQNALQPSDFMFMTRVHYVGVSDAKWGEHEIDHVMVVNKEVDVSQFNKAEIAEVEWVTPEQLTAKIEASYLGECPMSPWFRAIAVNLLLPRWWPALLQGRDRAVRHVEEDKVYRFLLDEFDPKLLQNVKEQNWRNHTVQ
jgi:isopentenyl-diphosphate delta-isomerase